jgi:hypothetical protein
MTVASLAERIQASGWSALLEQPGEKREGGQVGPRHLRLECWVCKTGQAVAGREPPSEIPPHVCAGPPVTLAKPGLAGT